MAQNHSEMEYPACPECNSKPEQESEAYMGNGEAFCDSCLVTWDVNTGETTNLGPNNTSEDSVPTTSTDLVKNSLNLAITLGLMGIFGIWTSSQIGYYPFLGVIAGSTVLLILGETGILALIDKEEYNKTLPVLLFNNSASTAIVSLTIAVIIGMQVAFYAMAMYAMEYILNVVPFTVHITPLMALGSFLLVFTKYVYKAPHHTMDTEKNDEINL